MPLEKSRKRELEQLCRKFRIDLIDLLYGIQTGHPGGSLSCCEILTLLYHEKMNIDPANPQMPNRDRLVLSKGHAAPMLYLNLADMGFFPADELKSLRQAGAMLQGHPCAHKTPGVDFSTGPLGLGLSAGCGTALSQRLTSDSFTTYVILGDGEIQEGAIWEAAMSASKFRIDSLIAILDRNGVQLDGTNDEIMPMGDIGAKFRAFGWEVDNCDGHNLDSLSDAIDRAKARRGTGKPSIIIAETVKGKGVSFMEGKSAWHGAPIDKAHCELAMADLGVSV